MCLILTSLSLYHSKVWLVKNAYYKSVVTNKRGNKTIIRWLLSAK